MAIINALTDTWNNVATTFTAIKMTVTDTTSAAGSKLIDLLVGATSMFNVKKDGTITTASQTMLVWSDNNRGMYAANGAVQLKNGSGVIFASPNSSGLGWCVGSNGVFGITGSTDAGGGIIDIAGGRNAAGVWEFNNGTLGIYRDIKFRHEITTGVYATSAAAPTIASAGTIAPTVAITFISGTTTISTITAPSPISAGGGSITLIPTGLWATNTAGNIALATTAVVSKALTMTYDVTTAKWYPSY